VRRGGLAVFPVNLNELEFPIKTNNGFERDGPTAGIAVFNELLAAGGNVNNALVGLPAIGALNLLGKQHSLESSRRTESAMSKSGEIELVFSGFSGLLC